MADEETYILTKEDFQEQQEVIKKQILGNTKLEGREKRMALTVLDGIGQSVMAGGVRQHGITKQMMKVSLPIFGKMSEDKRHNEKELKVLRALTMVVYEPFTGNAADDSSDDFSHCCIPVDGCFCSFCLRRHAPCRGSEI